MYTVHVTILDMQLYGEDVASPPSCQVCPPEPHAVPDLRDPSSGTPGGAGML